MKVLITDPIGSSGIEKLKQSGLEVVEEMDLKKCVELIEDADILIVRSRTRVTRDLIDKGKKLKIIARAGAGLDNIDVEYAAKKEIKVLNTPESVSRSVAELTIGLILSLARRIPYGDRTMKSGVWAKKEMWGVEVHGKTLGLIGFGRIGSLVGRYARALGMEILVHSLEYDINIIKEIGARLVDLETLLRESDFVSIHVPLLPETYRMINEEALSLMKPTAYLINTSRGQVVDEKALYNALASKKIAGAALDVYEVEPPTDLALIQLENVVCTPHVGAQTEEAKEKAASALVDKILGCVGQL